MVSALLLLAQGSEEIEAVVVIDVLRRAKINVTVASVEDSSIPSVVTCSRGVKIVPDISVNSVKPEDDYDAIILPGGLQGAKTFSSNQTVQSLLQKFHASGKKLICAICAAPMALAQAEIGIGSSITSHPVVKSHLLQKYKYLEDKSVVQDNNIITSRCPGTSFDFALAIVSSLTKDTDLVENVRQGLYIH